MDHDRLAFTENAITTTQRALEDSRITYAVKGQEIRLVEALENPIILNVTDGVINIPTEHRSDDSLPIVAIYPGETVRLGAGFDTQSPTQRAESIITAQGWGLEAEEAERLVADLSVDFSKLVELGALSFGAYNQASAVSPALAFSLPRVKESYGLPPTPSAKLGRIVGRNLIILQKHSQTFEQPEILSHEIAHFVEKTHNPISTVSSQRVSDMRQLREELKAYQVGARVYMHQHGILNITTNAEQVSHSSQLRVELTRMYANQGDSDPYRTTPQLIALLAKAGMDLEEVLHGRPDIEKMLAEVA